MRRKIGYHREVMRWSYELQVTHWSSRIWLSIPCQLPRSGEAPACVQAEDD